MDVDASYAQINQDGQVSGRLSALVGHNFFNDRLNLYAFGEYQRFDEVLDSDVDWRSDGWTLLNNDSDVNNATPDNQFDNILIRDARDAFFQRGGLVVLANQVLNSPNPADPDIVGGTCGGLGSFNAATTNIAGNAACFNIAPENLSTFVFNSTGIARPFNFGTFQDQNGASRRVNIGGDGLNVGTEFSQGSRLPESEAQRYQVGLNFDITPNIQSFLEAKFAHEETYDEGQPTFFQGGIGQSQAGLQNAIFGTTNFNIGDDNAYLDPALRALILANDRNTSATNTAQVIDRRATFNLFGPRRTQFNTREVTRYVAGLRGDLDQLGFISNFDWEASYTWGETTNENTERGVDVVRFAMSKDAVVDTAGLLGTPNAIVCRNRLLQAQGFATPNPFSTATVTNAQYAAAIAQCVPSTLFGVDMREDGYNPAAEAYYNASITVTHTNTQQDFLAFAAGELWDFWGAGPIGLSVGYEWREEETFGVGRSTGTNGRLLFLNTGPDFAPAGYDTTEMFGEINVPLIDDHPYLGHSAEFSLAYRHSDYSTVGPQEARSAQIQWRPVPDLLFRATYGESVRVPNLGENFGPATQTFANGLVDPCDANAINAQIEPIRSNRVANCQALATAAGLPANFIYSGVGPIGTSYIVGTASNGTYASGRSGVGSGNPFLAPERGQSTTFSISYQPSWWSDFSVVLDMYEIAITDAISTVTAQQALNQCVNGSTLNTLACATIFRNPAAGPDPFQLPSTGVGFIQGSLNYAKTQAQGVDFSVNYHFDIEEHLSWNLGTLDVALRGNWLRGQDDYTNIANPAERASFDTTVGLPRVRTLLTTTWTPVDRLRLIWDWDWQASQEIISEGTLLADADNRDPAYAETGDFSQHDFSMSYDLNDSFQFRAGVVNAFDAEPARWLGSATTADNFDLFGRRFYVGARFRH